MPSLHTGTALPTLSLKDLKSEEGRRALSKQFAEVARRFGFFQVVDHGVSQDLIDALFEVAEELFDLPMDEKLACKQDSHTYKGYEILGGQSLYGQVGKLHTVGVEHQGVTDLKEGWTFGSPHNASSKHARDYLYGPSKLPPSGKPERLRGVVTEYHDAMMTLIRSFFPVIGLALNGDESAVSAAIVDPVATIRLLRYPPQPVKAAHEAQIGVAPHTDYGLTTWLATSGVPGLEVLIDGEWQVVTVTRGAFIVNVGDLLSEWSGGRFHSALHRVINNTQGYRFSIPFFVEGDTSATVLPYLPSGKRGEPISILEHHRMRYEGTSVKTT